MSHQAHLVVGAREKLEVRCVDVREDLETGDVVEDPIDLDQYAAIRVRWSVNGEASKVGVMTRDPDQDGKRGFAEFIFQGTDLSWSGPQEYGKVRAEVELDDGVGDPELAPGVIEFIVRKKVGS